jgi:flagellar biosynthesis/type III secretory pathway M-ring protein FliF/YscJ
MLYLAIGALVLFLLYKGAIFVDKKYKAEAAVYRLERVVRDRDETIFVMKQAEAQRAEAEEAANAARTALELLQRGYNAIQNNITNTKDEDDGEIAPVLRNALRELDGLHTDSPD